MIPGYLNLYRSGKLSQLVQKLEHLLEGCRLCPRQCGVNRLKGERGFCQAGPLPKVYSFHLHHGEEPPISGKNGSGTIFFSYCNSRCVYCQNFTFSQLGEGKELSLKELAEAMIVLQKQGAHNINLVSPTHFSAQIVAALEIAAAAGLAIPLVYNTMAYDSLEVLKLLDGLVDIYLPDMRYGSDDFARRYSSLPDYLKNNQTSIQEMYRQVGQLKMENAIAQKGLIVRHLVLPNRISGTRAIMEFLAHQVSPKVSISLMRQYYPVYKASCEPLLARQITTQEWNEARQAMLEFGLENGWIQGVPTATERDEFLGSHFAQM